VTQRERVDISAVIDAARISPFQLKVFGLCFLVSLLDGFDTQSIAFVAPLIGADWKLTAASFGPIFSGGLLGTVVGAVALGRLADRYGRKRLIVVCVAVFAVFTGLCALAQGLTALLVYRFLAGIGLGGALPNVMAPVSEYSPQRTRSTAVVMTVWGFPLGAIVGGLLSSGLSAKFGWQAVFWVGGALPLLVLPFYVCFLPESIRFLALKSGSGAQIAAILSRIEPRRRFAADQDFFLPEPPAGEGKLRMLFSDGRAAGTVLLWTALFMSLLLSYLLLNWIPLLLRASGLPLKDALLGTVVLNFAGIVGSFVISRRMDLKGRPLEIMAAAYVLSALAATAIGWVQASFWPIMGSIFATGFFLIGAQMPLSAYGAGFYPTGVRATGLGWAQGVGRCGSILGPSIAGALLAVGTTPAHLFRLTCIPTLLAAGALVVLAAIQSRRTDAAKQTK